MIKALFQILIGLTILITSINYLMSPRAGDTQDQKPELIRAKKLVADFNCPVSSKGRWGNLYRNDMEVTHSIISQYENGINTWSIPIDEVIKMKISELETDCSGMKDDVKYHRDKVDPTLPDQKLDTLIDMAKEHATGKRKAIIEAAQERVAKIKHPRVCPIFTDSELEALIFDSSDANVLREGYGTKSSDASTLGQHPNMAVMKDCEKQARRITFFWDDHSYDAAKKRFAAN